MVVQLKKSQTLGALNLTPMIDVVFLLLIFFLVATRFEEDERQMDVVLPEASEAMPLVTQPRELFINIDQKGRYFVNAAQLAPAELLASLRQAHADNPGKATVIIRADRRCVWQAVATAMNLCNKAHIRDYRVTMSSDDG